MLSQKDEILSWSSARFVPESIADKKLPLAANIKRKKFTRKAGFPDKLFLVFYCFAIILSAIAKNFVRRFRERPFNKICENSLLEQLKTSNLCR